MVNDKDKKLSKKLIIFLAVVFPIGAAYCILHTLGKEFTTFLGGLCLTGIGIFLGILIVRPELVQSWIDAVAHFFSVIGSLWK